MPSSMASTMTDDYPSMLWVTIPPIVMLSAYYIRKWYLARRLRIHGIGKGAPGFQTNVRRIRVTPEIAARIRRGEQVSPEEIEAASKKADEEEATLKLSCNGIPSGAGVNTLPTRIIEERDDRNVTSQTKKDGPVENEWLPDSVTGPKKRGKGKKR
ncbi:hypothetical protein BYT27DRAFT_7149377 [Phlegmacium glaucopus]|nr:hypothetical protein BYT27DRAFT_7149377 [Phlegmacium glaucopus]